MTLPLSWVSRTAKVTEPEMTSWNASVMLLTLVFKDSSGLKAMAAAMPWGMVLVGSTSTWQLHSTEAWLAARMMLLLLGRMNTFRAFT